MKNVQIASAGVMTSTASKSTYAGSAFAVGGWLVSSEAAVFFGVVLGIAGFIVNLIFKWREDARQEAIHKLQVAELKLHNETLEKDSVLSRLKKNIDGISDTNITILQFAKPWWDIGGSIIRWALPQSRFRWALASHCGVLDGEYVIHACMFRGVVRELASEVVEGYSTQIACVYAVEDAKAGIEWARTQINKPYDWEGALGIALHPERDWQRDDAWFCFEFAAAVLQHSGLDIFTKTGHINSTHLMQLKHVRV